MSKNETPLTLMELAELSSEEIAEAIAWPEESINDLLDALSVDAEKRPEVLAEISEALAKERINDTFVTMPVQGHSSLCTILYRIAVREPNRTFPTMAVWMKGDGVTRFGYNPEFTIQLDRGARLFVVAHEAMHIILAHLRSDQYRREDEYWNIACEATINWLVSRRMHMEKVPAGGVDPKKIYAGYKAKEKQLGREPVTIEEFYASDATCYSHLKRTQPTYRNLQLCELGGGGDSSECPTCGGEGEVAAPQTQQSQDGQDQNGQDQQGGQQGQDGQDQNGQDGQDGQNGQDGQDGQDGQNGPQGPNGQQGQNGQGQNGQGQDGQQGEQGGHGNGKIPCPNCKGSGKNPNDHPYDPETLKDLVEGSIRQAIQRAVSGDKNLRAELEELAAATPEASKIWGDLGLGALRGETDKGRAHSVWAALMRDALMSRLSDEEGRPAYSRKTGHFPTPNPRIGNPLAPVGREEERFALIAVDTSGSMPDHVLERVGRMVGQIPNCEARWLWWDGEAYEFEPGDDIVGGGGTTTQSVTRWIDENLEGEFPDVVVMVTDGHVSGVDQSFPYPYPERWIWLITQGGNTWPDDRGMRMIEVDDLSVFVN